MFRKIIQIHQEKLSFAALLAVSMALHFVNLTHPVQVVFDEFHFGKFVNAYCCSHETIFDIHPPHPKLIMAWLAKLWGYDGRLGFMAIGDSLAGAPIFALRLWPATVGALIPLVGFWLLRLWRVPLAWAFTGGMALALENGILVQTRIMALDGQLLLGSLLSVLMCEKMLRARTGAGQIAFGLFTGLSLALTVSAKFTGLAVIAILGFQLIQQFMRSGMKLHWTKAAIVTTATTALAAFGGFMALYLAGWKLHFMWLTKPGLGTAFYSLTGNFLHDVFALHKIMLSANNGITTSHPWTSPWWQWPMMQKPIYYWVDQGAMIYFAGNPVVWWGSLGTTLILLVWMGLSRSGAWRGPHANLLIVGWAASFIPYAFVSRGLFLYHYLPPLMWLILLTTILLSRQPTLNSKSSLIKPWHVLSLIICGFVITMPVTFGFVGWKEIPVQLLRLR